MEHTLFLTGVESFLAAAAGFFAFDTFPFSAATFFTLGLCARPDDASKHFILVLFEQAVRWIFYLTLVAAAFLVRGAIFSSHWLSTRIFVNEKSNFLR